MWKYSLFQYCDIANMLTFLLLLPTVPVLEFKPDWLQCMQIFLHKCVQTLVNSSTLQLEGDSYRTKHCQVSHIYGVHVSVFCIVFQRNELTVQRDEEKRDKDNSRKAVGLTTGGLHIIQVSCLQALQKANFKCICVLRSELWINFSISNGVNSHCM